jgi:gliding motility-associated-like protein
MRTMTKISRWLLGALMFLMALPVDATHYMGGEITWECLPNGDFRFIMKLYRECYTTNGNAAANFANTETMQTTVPGFPSITMTRITGWPVDISPACNTNPSFPHIVCTGMTPPGNANWGAVQEHVYTSDGAYPNGVPLTGVPPVNGWVFSHTSCCRNPCTNIPGSNGMNWYLRAIMYPYNNQNVSVCYDNSPKFQEIPRTVICTGYPFTYNHNASDKELDVLNFEWAQPWTGNNQPINTWSPGYSWNSTATTSPLPGIMHNPNNVPATVNLTTGEISFTSYTIGAFVTVTKVTAYKCGIKVAEIFREMQVVLLQCGTNTPPDVTPPFQNALGQYTLFNDTVYAGEFVTFALSGTDFEFLPNSAPQTMTMQATGLQFGTGFTNTTAGCLAAPCATLTPAPPVTGQFGVQTTFNWQTHCDHLAANAGCGTTSNLYTFVIRTQDDFCPAPAINIATITILVLDHPQLPSPRMGCTEVLPNGSVRLTWEEVIDTFGTFDSYWIYHSTNLAGPYTALDSIFNINTNTYLHNGANANNQINYYYFTTRSGCNADKMSLPTDTIETILLDVVNPGAAFGVANLSWNAPATPLNVGMSGVYEVFREYPPGNWVQIGTSNTSGVNAYVDIITVCSQFINYRVEMVDTFGYDSLGAPLTCRIVSSVDGDLFADVTPPQTPVFDSITVDPLTQQAFLTWDVNPSADTEGYIIYRWNGTIWVPVDTVPGINNNTWVDLTGIPCDQVETYNIAAFDSCGNTSPMGLEHKTIHTTLTVDPCQDEISVTWTDYINMNPGVTDYEIWVSENGNLPLLQTTVPSSTLTYQHAGLNSGSTYCYYIHAVNGGTSSSTACVACIDMVKPGQPQYAYLRTATVVNNNHVTLKAYIDDLPSITEYRIMRSATGAPGSFAQIGTVTPPGGTLLSFNDLAAQVRQNSYYYKFVVVDSCGVEAMESNVARTIHLQIVPNIEGKENILNWNDYEGWDSPPVGPSGTPTEYMIYRIVDGGLPTAITPLVPAGAGTFADDVQNYIENGGDFSYYIDALEGPGNTYLFSDTSRSNMVQALHPPKLYVPNAFTPNGDGMNDDFRPMTNFIPAENYELFIFNRWGQLLWQTKDKNQGWDGKIDGELAPAGAYVYLVRFTTSSGKPFERQGSFLLKP